MSPSFAVGILHKNGKFLAEQRKSDKSFHPNAVIFPGGHLEPDETPEQGLHREMEEELGITLNEYEFIDNFIASDGKVLAVFLIRDWEGEPKALEAEKLIWIEKIEEITDPLNQKMLKSALQKLTDLQPPTDIHPLK